MSIVNNIHAGESIYSNHSNIWVRIGANAKNSTMLWFMRFDVLGPFCVDVMYQESATPGVDIRVGDEIFTRLARYEFTWKSPLIMELAIK